jgi:hypothetical protein
MAIVLSCCLLNRRPKDPKNHCFFPTGLDSQGKLWVAVPWDFLVGGETAFSPSNPSNRNDHLIDYQDPKNWTKQSCPFGERLNKPLFFHQPTNGNLGHLWKPVMPVMFGKCWWISLERYGLRLNDCVAWEAMSIYINWRWTPNKMLRANTSIDWNGHQLGLDLWCELLGPPQISTKHLGYPRIVLHPGPQNEVVRNKIPTFDGWSWIMLPNDKTTTNQRKPSRTHISSVGYVGYVCIDSWFIYPYTVAFIPTCSCFLLKQTPENNR